MTVVSRAPVAILVGAPGAGKSTIGKKVAERFMLPFVDTDEIIETQAGMSVADIFVTEGEERFRERERQAVADALETSLGIVSLGGGAVTQQGTRDLLAGHRVTWLRVSAGEAAKRVGMNATRPLLVGNVRGTLQRLLQEREVWYEEVSTDTVDTTNRPIHDVVRDVCTRLEQS